jgi:L-iditol 2-dehydrogenase
MRAALLLKPEQINIGEVDVPLPGPGEVIFKPSLAGICGTDISIYRGHRPADYPFILGHEAVGRIISVGEGVDKFCAGQRVIIEPNYPCGGCSLCKRGRGAVCAQKKSMGVNIPGCFSQLALAPAEFVWPLPDSISDQDAATIEPLAVSMHALLQSGVQIGDAVAVLGCGVVGLLMVHSAVTMGLRVFAHDRIIEKQEMARKLGAEIAEAGDIAELWRKNNVCTVFECAGVPETVELALSESPRGALVVLLGLSSASARFSPIRLVREGINIATSMIYDHPADFERVIKLVAGGVLHPSCVVTHTFPFDSIGSALELAGAGQAGKVHVLIV